MVTIAAGLVLYFLPKLFEKGKRLSYEVEGPISYVNPQVIPNVKILVSDIEVKNVFGYRVKIVNSGDVPLKDLPITF